jgi:hypothetical protein
MRRRPRPSEVFPVPLQRFVEADWQEWLLDGRDPGIEGYVDVDTFYAGIADRPELVAAWRRLDAHQRWTAARRAWLEERGMRDLAIHYWIQDIQEEHRVLRAQIREAAG